MQTLENILKYSLFSFDKYSIKVYTLVLILMVLLVTKFLLWILRRLFFRKKLEGSSLGDMYAVFQILKYFIWVVAIALILEILGIKVTLLLAGSAALLVGIGLGLQQTFNDVVSGFILLSERSIKKEDVLEIDSTVVKMKEIGLRTSRGLTRDNISIIVPNSLITTNKVINWSHQSEEVRFGLKVGVAYGSCVETVEKILKESAKAHLPEDKRDSVEVFFKDFGSNSLDFEVRFFSEEVFFIERLKSLIRKSINENFSKHNIVISFPQLDVHLKREE